MTLVEGTFEIPHYEPPRYAVKAQAEETPFRLTCEATSIWRPETQPWERSVPWDGRPIEIDPVTNRPLKVKAKPATAEIGVQTEPVHIEPIQTELPKEAEDSSGIDLKRLCAAIANFQEVHEREHKQLEMASEETQELQELQPETVHETDDESVEMLENLEPVTSEKSFMEEAQEKAQEALSQKARWEKMAQDRRMAEQLARGETPTPDPRWLPREPRPRMKKKHDNWEDFIKEFDDPETVDLEGLWVPVEPHELPKGTPILTVEVNLGGEEFPLGPLEYTTENTVEEACHDFVAEHNLRPIFEPLLQAYVCYTVMKCIEEASLDVLTLL